MVPKPNIKLLNRHIFNFVWSWDFKLQQERSIKEGMKYQEMYQPIEMASDLNYKFLPT